MVSLVHYASSSCFFASWIDCYGPCIVCAYVIISYTCVRILNEFLWIIVEERGNESKLLEFLFSVLSILCVCNNFQKINRVKMATNCWLSAGIRPQLLNSCFVIINLKIKVFFHLLTCSQHIQGKRIKTKLEILFWISLSMVYR